MTDETFDPHSLNLQPLPGSERSAAPDAAPVQSIAPDTEISITLVVRRRAPVPDEALDAPMPRAEFAALYGADPADFELVTRTLTALGVQVSEADPASRRLRVTGTVGRLSEIFGAQLSEVSSTAPTGDTVQHRHRTGGLSVPGVLDGVVTAVLGLDNRPQARAKLRLAMANTATTSFTPPQLGNVYQFPPATDGTGERIAIIELGGGYEQADLDTYFNGLGLSSPTVTAIGVDGASNVGGQDPNGADGEVLLDIEWPVRSPRRRPSTSTSRRTPTTAFWTRSARLHTPTRRRPR